MYQKKKKKPHQKANKHLSQLNDRSCLDEKPLRNSNLFLRGVGGAGPQAYRMWGLSSWTWDQTWATAVTPNGQTPENSLGTTRKGLTFHFKQR